MSDKYKPWGKQKITSHVAEPIPPDTASKKRYVVTRNGFRVSENDYASISEATEEFNRQKKILEKWPDRSKLEIVEKI
jgi:hypothetical protein